MIRKIQKDDYSELRKLIREFMIDYNRKEVLKGLQLDYMQYKDNEKFISKAAEKLCNLKSPEKALYVYEEDGRIIGYIYGEVHKNTDRVLPIAGQVEDWFVSKQKRGNGIGKKLWEKIIEFFKEHKAQTVKLEVYSQNIDTYKLYKYVYAKIK